MKHRVLLAAVAVLALVGCTKENPTVVPGAEIPAETENITDKETTAMTTEDTTAAAVTELRPTGDKNTVVYPLPACYTERTDVTVTVNGFKVPVIEMVGLYDYCTFSCAEGATVTVTVQDSIGEATVSPIARNIENKVEGNTLTYTMGKPEYLIITIDSERPLVIAADALETDVPPSRGEGIYNILDYDADPSGTELSTSAINKAIQAAEKAGGGTVYVPAGVYTVTNIVLRSHVDLYLEGGSVLSAYTEGTKKYTWHYVKNSIDNANGTWLVSTAPYSEDMKIYGRGTIDANGTKVRNERSFLISPLVPHQCSGFTADGIILRDGGLWSTMIVRSDNVTLTNTKHLNENEWVKENDAIDVLESQHVRILHTIAISEDDAYSLKCYAPGANEIKKSWVGDSEANEDVLFEDCFAWSRCGAYKVGWGVFGGMKDITFRNSYVYRCMTGVNVTHFHGSGVAENITYENIDIEGFARRAIFNSPCQWLVMETRNSSGIGPIRNVTIKDINVRQNIGSGLIHGVSDVGVIENVSISGITFLGKQAKTAEDMALVIQPEFVRSLTIEP